MGRALAVTGLEKFLRMAVALIPATTEDRLAQVDATRIVENQLNNCKLSLFINFLPKHPCFQQLVLTTINVF